MKTSGDKDKAIAMLGEQMAEVGLPALDTEIRFHPQRLWRIDYGYKDLKIGVEYEGGVYGMGKPCPVCKQRGSAGAHTRGKHFESDAEKYAEANLFGWIIIRTTTNLIKDRITINLLKRAYVQRVEERKREAA